jgi:hypothetical protein
MGHRSGHGECTAERVGSHFEPERRTAMFAHSHRTRSAHDLDLPEGPDELLGLTESGKGIVGILLVAATLGLLVWLAIALGIS